MVETDTNIYILRMDKVKDDDATASKKESLENTKRSEYYSETTQKWLDDAKITVDEKVLDTLEITDDHIFSIKEVAADTDTAKDSSATDKTDSTDKSQADSSDSAEVSTETEDEVE